MELMPDMFSFLSNEQLKKNKVMNFSYQYKPYKDLLQKLLLLKRHLPIQIDQGNTRSVCKIYSDLIIQIPE